ncbi:MAG TPA: glycoside hydrolase family 88 protein [Opitutaceae bacterium]|nr:glycoside hydrolase family 88 protein [Opitutaceae bacterium]
MSESAPSIMKSAKAAPKRPAASTASGNTSAPSGPGIINPAFSAARPRAVYPVPYGVPQSGEIAALLARVRDYLAANTPARVVDRETGAEITNFKRVNRNATLERGVFNIIGYEWGVTYSGMLLAADVTKDRRFRSYVDERLTFIAEKAPYFRSVATSNGQPNQGTMAGRGGGMNLFRAVLNPRTLDDSGSMCAAMIRASRARIGGKLEPLIENYLDWITKRQQRLADGTFSRSRPLPDSVWLDDLYMSVPALAQRGDETGDARYFDEAVKQVLQFADRMFNREKGLWVHGWVQGMTEHPAYHWARANGWALLAMTELLDVLPAKHPGRAAILDLYRAQVRGLARVQGRDGRWHQLLDRNDSYLETSGTAIYAYCVARGINRGWIESLAYGPMAVLAWHSVSAQVNDAGQVENVCVGTGMGFDPAFYYSRPVSPVAPHGYGPVLLAGAEMITLAKSDRALINDEAVMFGRATGM